MGIQVSPECSDSWCTWRVDYTLSIGDDFDHGFKGVLELGGVASLDVILVCDHAAEPES